MWISLLIEHKGIDDIKVSSIPIPIPAEDEVLVKIEAAGVNFIDQLYVNLPALQLISRIFLFRVSRSIFLFSEI